MGCVSAAASAVKEGGLPQSEESFFEKYTLGGKLGKGGFAQVRLLEQHGGSALAVKIVDLRQPDNQGRLLPSARIRKDALEEAAVWRQAGIHENIVGLVDGFMTSAACFYVMDLCDQSFQSFLSEHSADGTLNERTLQLVFKHLLSGLAHVHDKMVVHRDVKPDNVMVHNGTCRLCDFGLSAVLPRSGRSLSGIVGTAPFLSPEMLNEGGHGTETDIWSLGILAYLLFFGDFPVVPQVRNSEEMKRIIKDGTVLPTFLPKVRSKGKHLPSVSEHATLFVRSMLTRDKADRVDAPSALQCTFLTRDASDDRLPSLKPTFASCMVCGAFENLPVKYDTHLDPVLEKLHRKHTGKSLSHKVDLTVLKSAGTRSSRSDTSTTASRQDVGEVSTSSFFSDASLWVVTPPRSLDAVLVTPLGIRR